MRGYYYDQPAGAPPAPSPTPPPRRRRRWGGLAAVLLLLLCAVLLVGAASLLGLWRATELPPGAEPTFPAPGGGTEGGGTPVAGLPSGRAENHPRHHHQLPGPAGGGFEPSGKYSAEPAQPL